MAGIREDLSPGVGQVFQPPSGMQFICNRVLRSEQQQGFSLYVGTRETPWLQGLAGNIGNQTGTSLPECSQKHTGQTSERSGNIWPVIITRSDTQ